ncbi:MAG: hypothetical protein WBN68_15380 [Sedimenticolaceae bacterium]
MLTIKDLSASNELDRAAMTDVRGGFLPGIFNLPVIDSGYHFLAQGQALAVDQSYNLGGLNLVINNQEQNGVSGQAVG